MDTHNNTTTNATLEIQKGTTMNFEYLKTLINHNKPYVLQYVYNFDLPNKLCMEFTACEIEQAINLLPMYLSDAGSVERLNQGLLSMMKASGRLNLGKTLPEDTHAKTIKFVQCVKDGCKDCRETMNQDFAVYLALNLETITEEDREFNDLWSGQVCITHTVFDENEMDHYFPDNFSLEISTATKHIQQQ